MNSSLYMLKEAELGTNLKVELKSWRKQGLSFDQIADVLSQEGATVHGSTVVRWARELNIQ
jgi:transposase-like protein